MIVNNFACANWGGNQEWDWGYNVFADPGADCMSTSHAKQCTPAFVNPSYANGNGDIVANDPCVRSAADPRSYPPTDMRGKPRWAPDAGATAVTQRPSKTKLLARLRSTANCELLGLLPDRACSPGAIYTDATAQIVCAPLYASRALNVSKSTMAAGYRRYGIPIRQRGRLYLIDHIVPLELGGSNDPANLFPQSRSHGFRGKNALERRLHEFVCDGQRKLRPTQRAMARDWVALYRQVFGRSPG